MLIAIRGVYKTHANYIDEDDELAVAKSDVEDDEVDDSFPPLYESTFGISESSHIGPVRPT